LREPRIKKSELILDENRLSVMKVIPSIAPTAFYRHTDTVLRYHPLITGRMGGQESTGR